MCVHVFASENLSTKSVTLAKLISVVSEMSLNAKPKNEEQNETLIPYNLYTFFN